MSGIRSGTRLEQLEDLRRRVTLQLEHARRTHTPTEQLQHLAAAIDDQIRAEGGTPPPPGPTVVRRRRHAPHAADTLMVELGVTAAVVRAWAIENGLLDGVRRGRLALVYVQAYATHHHTKDTA